MTRDHALEIAVGCWCTPANASKEVDADLVAAFADALQAEVNKVFPPLDLDTRIENMTIEVAKLKAQRRMLKPKPPKPEIRRRFTCPRCYKFIEVELDQNGRTTCPACENEVTPVV